MISSALHLYIPLSHVVTSSQHPLTLYSHMFITICSDAQLCPTLCNPTDYSPPGSSVHGILQARILAWVAVPACRWSSRPKDQTHISNVICTGSWVLYTAGTSVVIQWLRLCAPKVGDAGSIPGHGNQIPRSHMYQLRPGAAKQTFF